MMPDAAQAVSAPDADWRSTLAAGRAEAPELRFDAGWYVDAHRDVAALIERGGFLDPLHHYVMAGCREGKSPNAEFREQYYRGIYPDVARAVDARVFSCGFEHYLRFGRAEGRRIRPAVHGALVDMTGYGGVSALHERIRILLAETFGKFPQSDFWLLTGEANHDALAAMDAVNVSRICVDRIAGDVPERWKTLPVRAFIAPFGPSDHYAPAFRTLTILPEVPAGRPGPSARDAGGVDRALSISEAVLCLTLPDRSKLLDGRHAERQRVQLLHLPPSSRIARELRLPTALRPVAGRPFLLTDLTGAEASPAVAVEALAGLAGLPGGPLLVAAVPADGAARLAALAAEAGAGDALAAVECPDAAVWRWAVENCRGLLETARRGMTPGLLEDALAFRLPLVCARQSGALRSAGDLGSAYDADDPRSVAAACRRVLDDGAAVAASAAAIARGFPGLGSDDGDGPLGAFLEGMAAAARPAEPAREILLGLRDGNRIHASVWFALPASAASRSLVFEIAVPDNYPEPSVVAVVSADGVSDVQSAVERGRSARIALALPPGRVAGRLVLHPRRADGGLVKQHPGWPGVELRAAAVLSSGVNLLGAEAAGSVAQDAGLLGPEFAASTINAAIDVAAPALNALEAAVASALAARPALRLTFPGLPGILRAAPPVALHLTRAQFTIPELRYHGSNKDQASRQQYLRDRGFHIRTEPVKDWKFRALMERLDAERHDDPQVILVEAMHHHPLLRYLRDRFPQARLLVRSHNAEVLHRIDTHTATLLMEKGSRLAWLNPVEALPRARNVLAHWRYDAGAIELADHILSITAWETDRYWPRLGPRHKVATVPYFLPRDLAPERPAGGARPRCCVCLTSASPGPVIYDALRNFARLVDGLDDPAGWDFAVTGELDGRYAAASTRCRFTGRVDDPIGLMRGAAAMALLSPYGYGFKTKILDAVSAGCYTLLPQSLLDRHPAAVHPYCLAVDLASPASFRAALEASLEPFPEGDPNEELRRQAYAALDAVLGIG